MWTEEAIDVSEQIYVNLTTAKMMAYGNMQYIEGLVFLKIS